MNYTLSKAIIFVAGAAIGSIVTWQLLKTKYEHDFEIELDEMRDYYSNKIEKEYEEQLAKDRDEYDNLVKYSGYNNYSDTREEKKEEVESMEKPYVIPPEEFGEEDEYDRESLTYYADGVLTDDWDNPIEDVDGMVGVDSLNHFGEYEDDSVFVRNDYLRTDYEILLDKRNFADVIGEE